MISTRFHLSAIVILAGISLVYGFPQKVVSKQCEGFCGENGLCVLLNDQPACYCYPGWRGARCDVARQYSVHEQKSFSSARRIQARYFECTLLPPDFCNTGICQFENATFSCACPFDRIGDRCEIRSPCVGFCMNNGYCSLENSTNSVCNCTDTGFIGTRCDVPMPPTTTLPPNTTTSALCAAFQPFCNGAPCQLVSGRPTCVCPPNSNPPYCTPITTPGTTVAGVPTAPPTAAPTAFPTAAPTAFPTAAPTAFPTAAPTAFPTAAPTAFPTAAPTAFPTAGPTAGPMPGVTCAANPCRNGRPCYNSGNSYFCFCGNLYTGFNCEFLVGK